MAKVKTMPAPEPIIWVPPPVTKSDVAEPWRHPNGGFYRDGMDGGGESGANSDIDAIVYPQDRSPEVLEGMKGEADRKAQADKIKGDFERRQRDFRITEGGATGEKPGSPSLFDKEE